MISNKFTFRGDTAIREFIGTFLTFSLFFIWTKVHHWLLFDEHETPPLISLASEAIIHSLSSELSTWFLDGGTLSDTAESLSTDLTLLKSLGNNRVSPLTFPNTSSSTLLRLPTAYLQCWQEFQLWCLKTAFCSVQSWAEELKRMRHKCSRHPISSYQVSNLIKINMLPKRLTVFEHWQTQGLLYDESLPLKRSWTSDWMIPNGNKQPPPPPPFKNRYYKDPHCLPECHSNFLV